LRTRGARLPLLVAYYLQESFVWLG